MRTLIRGGQIVTGEGVSVGDVLVVDEKIVALGDLGEVEADRLVDARDKYVLPGGVDPHTHLATTFRGQTTRDDFRTGTVAAVCGGTTSIVDFCTPGPGESPLEAVAAWRDRLERSDPSVDAGVHLVLVQPNGAALAELPALAEQGITSVKLYMAYRGRTMTDDEGLFRAMQAAANLGMTVLVHAENGAVIDVLVQQALAAGHTAPIWHARTRPPLTEAEAVHRAAALARLAGARLYVVHVSCREALEELTAARVDGAALWGETCPQYLVLDESALEQEMPSAAAFVFTPPARPKHHQDALWAGLAAETLSVLATDHCPFDLAGQKVQGSDFTLIMNGAAGIEQRLMLAHHFGVRAGRITLPQLAKLTAENPAQIFGLAEKGRIAVGRDADLVVFDPEMSLTISATTHHSAVDHLPYEGLEVVGAPEVVLLRGRIVVADGEPLDDGLGHGRFLARQRAGERLEQTASTPAGRPR